MQGLSMLLILEDLIQAISATNVDITKEKLRPCDLFDMIGGVGIGGWLALLLGRFRLDVAECIRAYNTILSAISNAAPRGRRGTFRQNLLNEPDYDESELTEVINYLIKKYDVGTSMLIKDLSTVRCRFW
jgi:patatin-like phospholipase/acyl hydrolase